MVSLWVATFGVVIILVIQNLVTANLIASKTETIDSILSEQTHETARRLDDAKGSADVVAEIPEIGEYLELKDPKFQDEKVLKILKEFGLGRSYESLYIINTNGIAMTSTDPSFVKNDFSFRKYVINALAGNSYSEMAIGSVSNKLGFYFSTPVKNAENRIVGVVAVKLDPAVVFNDLVLSKVRDYGHLFFVNSDGVIVSATKPEFLYKSLDQLNSDTLAEIAVEKRYPNENVTPLDYSKALQVVIGGNDNSKVFFVNDKIDMEQELIALRKVGNYRYYLMSESNQTDVLAAVKTISLVIMGIIAGALFLGVIIQLLFLRFAFAPLRKLVDYAGKVSSGAINEAIEINTGDELQSLSESIQDMVLNIKGLYKGLEEQVTVKTAELSGALAIMEVKNGEMDNSKKAMLNVMEDLNDEKEKIAAEKNRIETILSSIGDGVFVTDEQGRLVMVNQAVEKMSGFTNTEMYGKNYAEIFKFVNEDSSNSEYPNFVNEVIVNGNVLSLLPHTVLISKNGNSTPVLDSAAPLRTAEGKVFGCVVVVRDNTKERELERSKDDFLSVASHQLRTPLGSMRWSLEMLLNGDAGELNAEATEIAKQIYDGNLRMIGLVNDLLDVSRIDQGKVMDNPTVVDLGETIDKIIMEIEPLTMAKNVQISSTIDKKVPKLNIDLQRFREVMTNLISNAVKYNKIGGLVTVDLAGDEANIVITISDNGIGIPKNDLVRLGSKFFRAKNAIHSESEGTGLGLYVARKFVEGWGGKLIIESEVEVGSKMTVRLPVEIKSKIKE